MSLLAICWLAVGLAMDATAVAIAASLLLEQVNRRQVFRFAFHFGLFQGLMPVVGWFAGRGFHGYIAAWDHWVAFGLLAFVGGKAILDVLRKGDEAGVGAADPTRGFTLVVLSLATSIDALAAGLSLAVLDTGIWYPAAVIGLVTAIMTLAGMVLASRLGQRFGLRVRFLGGVILLGIGVKVLADHAVF